MRADTVPCLRTTSSYLSIDELVANAAIYTSYCERKKTSWKTKNQVSPKGGMEKKVN